MSVDVYLNRIGTAVPPNDVHGAFCAFAESLLPEAKHRELFARMAVRAEIDCRWSYLRGDPDHPALGDRDGFYRAGAFPPTSARMARYEAHAPDLALAAVGDLDLSAGELAGVTHLVVATCTGFFSPGVDLAVARVLGLAETVERTIVGFMGCQAAITALKLARHLVRSEPGAKVLVINLELCTLHLQQRHTMDQLLCFLLFGDGCSAGLVSAERAGMRLDGFSAAVMADASEQITWRVGDDGFDMTLSGLVPLTLSRALPPRIGAILAGRAAAEIDLWAVHPGGRTVLDAVDSALCLPQGALRYSREVLRRFGNMSSPTVMFVLRAMLDEAVPDRFGCAMAFGPGLSAEAMQFVTV
jgi:predicted naringenin-chalcone synthase